MKDEMSKSGMEAGRWARDASKQRKEKESLANAYWWV